MGDEHIAGILSDTRVEVFRARALREYEKMIRQCFKKGAKRVVVSWKGHYYRYTEDGEGYRRVEISPSDPDTLFIPE